MGLADYLNRDTTAEAGDLGTLLLQAAAIHQRIATIAAARRRTAELAQMSEADAAVAGDLEPTIQKCEALERDSNKFCASARKHGLHTAARLTEHEDRLRQKYAVYCIIKPAPV